MKQIDAGGVNGDTQDGLVLIPRGEDLDALRADYNFMIEEGLLLEDVHEFDDLIAQCTALQKEANEAVSV
jgi:hypothetical protein